MADMNNDRNNNRDNAGRFVVGNQVSKGRGRPAGSKNKSSERIRQFFSDFIENNMGELNDSFSELKPREKFSVLLEMAKYILPTMRAQGDLIDELSDEMFDEVVERIKQDFELN